MRNVLKILLLLIPVFSHATEVAVCKGSVLQRRFALIQFGRMADAYVASKGALPDICLAPVEGISGNVPQLLKGSMVCGSSKEGSVHYSCEIPAKPSDPTSNQSPVIESCRYSLTNQSVACENRSVMTTFGEAD